MNKNFKIFKRKVGKVIVSLALAGSITVNSFAFADTTNPNNAINSTSSNSTLSSSSVQTSSSQIGTVTSSSLSVRKKASSSSTLLGKLYKNDTIIILGETKYYFKINYKNDTGYVSKKYISLDSYLTSDNTFKTTSSLNVRTGSNTSYSSLGKLTKGQIIHIKKVCSNGWYIIDFGNKMGCISPKYTQKVDDNTKNSDIINISKVVNCDSLNIRSGASASYKKLDEILYNEEVEVLDNSGSWAKIRYKNLTGYVLKKYITSDSPVETTNTIKTTTTLNVRKGSSSSFSALGKLEKGQVVTIKQTASNGWYAIDFGNQTGYISPKYAQMVDDDTKNSDIVKTTTITSNSLNIRAGRSTSYAILDKIKSGETVDIVTDTNPKSGWSKIRYKNLNGYVSTKYLKSETPSNQAPVITANDITINCGSSFSYSMLNAKATDKEDGTITNLAYVGSVNPKKVGSYKVTITAKDSSGLSSSISKTVTVKAVNPTVEGSHVTLYQGDTFNNSMINASAVDCEGNPLNYTIEGSVDTSTPGIYTLYIRATDKWNLNTCRIVHVTVKEKEVQNTKPTITADNVTIEVGDKFDFDMLNAKATDKEDGTITNLAYVGSVNPKKVGSYKVTITAKDSSGLSSSISKTVTVKAVNPTVEGSHVTLYQGDTFNNSMINASAVDCEGNPLNYTIEGSVDTSTPGIYTLYIHATDKWNLMTSRLIYVTVKEKEVQNTKPTVTADDITIEVGDKFDYDMLNVKATDKEDGVIKDLFFSDNVNTSKAGTYTVTITATDSKGAEATITVTVTVKEKEPEKENTLPVITAKKDLTLTVGDTFNKSMLNIKATDAEDGDLTDKVIIEGTVDTTKAATYTLTLIVIDSEGDDSSIKVTVTVKEKEPEVQGYTVNSPECRRIIQDEMYRLVNQHRANNGKSALTVSSALENTAYLKSEDMGVNDYFDHQYNGKDIWEYKDCADADGENIALCGWNGTNGKLTEQDCKDLAKSLFKMWKNSAGHNAAMISKLNKLIGFDLYLVDRGNDAYTVYATQEFRIK